jgi:NADH-quinone oxidoreductase subunit J
MTLFFFFALSIICAASVLAMVFSRNPAYSALYLVLAFACLGGLFGLLGAPFLAVVQIIIYAGAIMVLFIFVIMMINVTKGLSPEKKKRTKTLSILLAIVLLFELGLTAAKALSGSSVSGVAEPSAPRDIGRLIFTRYIYPFEITSVLIIAALVGAIVLVKKKEDG